MLQTRELFLLKNIVFYLYSSSLIRIHLLKTYLLPWVESDTSDINVTLGIIKDVAIRIQYNSIRVIGNMSF